MKNQRAQFLRNRLESLVDAWLQAEPATKASLAVAVHIAQLELHDLMKQEVGPYAYGR